MSYMEEGIETMRRLGLRITTTRRIILSLLERSQGPVSALDLYQQLKSKQRSTRVDRISVYRVLMKLEKIGLVHRVPPKGRFMACLHGGCRTKHHLLMSCRSCERVVEVDVPEGLVAPLHRHVRRRHGFAARSHFLQVDGVCGRCRKLECGGLQTHAGKCR